MVTAMSPRQTARRAASESGAASSGHEHAALLLVPFRMVLTDREPVTLVRDNARSASRGGDDGPRMPVTWPHGPGETWPHGG
jgi:hypothetical protein